MYQDLMYSNCLQSLISSLKLKVEMYETQQLFVLVKL